MSENDDKKTLEKFTLLPNRYYIILEKVDEERFGLSAYDTTKSDRDIAPCAAEVAQEGLLELLDTDFERVVGAGVARIETKRIADHDNTLSQLKDKLNLDNVIKIDFGEKQ
tara:strand:+ start:3911 stop:4243 length:333 start_codon:yes stop_codon:yes gene_type:complete